MYPIRRSKGVFFVTADSQEFWCTVQEGAMCASCSAEFCKILGDTAPKFDWFFPLLHQFEGDMPY